MRDRSVPAVPEAAASCCQSGPSVLYSQQKGVTAMIKLIPSPKTYEISDEVLRFPLKLFTEEADFLPGAEVFAEAHLEPITVPPTDRVLGAILCSWEQSFELEIGALMENLAALSERTWNVRRSVTDEEYTEMYQAQRLRLARLIQDR